MKSVAEPEDAGVRVPRYVVFGGGGTHGVAYLGAMEALEDTYGEECATWNLAGVAGTSAGSVAALCVAIGLKRADRRRIVLALSDLTSVVPCPDLHLFYRSYGWDTGIRFRALLQEALVCAGLSPEATLADLRRLLRLDFACVCTDLVTCEPVVLRADDAHAHMRVVDAVYASCCVPFLFVPPESTDGRILVDGCLTCNVPHHIFPGGADTMIVCIDPTVSHRPENLAQYANAVIRCSTIAQFRAADKAAAATPRLVIAINADPSFHTSMTEEDFDAMYADGYTCACDFLQRGRLVRAAGLLGITAAVVTSTSSTAPRAGAPHCD